MRTLRFGSLRAALGRSLLWTSGLLLAAFCASPALAQQSPPAASGPSLHVPYTKYKLDNGLTVILHQDRTVPLVSVNTMVKVGSRFETVRRSGFAHLFEHLMFMGTHRAPPKMFDAWMEAYGGHNNAWTSEDRTDYFDAGPSTTLPLLLWLEADRFSSLADNMSLDKLNAQREVVRNERRQRSENEPYGKVDLRLPELLYPVGHPYHHPVIGSHEDLQAATVDDVKSFFGSWYVPNNMSLVVAGDIDSDSAKTLVQRYFGVMRPATIPVAPAAPAVRLTTVVRETIPDRVDLGKVVMAWPSPARFAPGDADLDLCAAILQQGKSSRLYKALVYDQALAQEVSAHQSSGDLSSQFIVEAIARPGVPLEKLEAAIDVELKKIISEAVSDTELRRAKNQYETAFVARLQSITERATMLNDYEMSRGDPDYAEKDLERYRAVRPETLLETAKATLNLNGRVILYVVPEKGTPSAAKPQGAGQ